MNYIKKFRINEILAIVLFISYFKLPKDGKGYIGSKFWLGVSETNVITLIPFQILSAIGFVIWYYSIGKTLPDKGLLSLRLCNNPIHEVLTFLILVGSIGWSLSLFQKNFIENKTMFKTIVSFSSLLLVAICGVLIHIGCFQANNIKYYSIVGIILFNITVVLNDCIGWSGRLIDQTIN